MKNASILPVFLITIFLFTEPIHAELIGYYPGLKELIDKSDAIVILRVDRDLSDYTRSTLYSTHECYIYQTFKGNITKNTKITLQLMDTQTYLDSPYAHGSVHLMFLMKKQTENEPTEYRTIDSQGAHFRLSPLGNEKAPEGKTIEEQIRNLINKAISYETEEYEKRQRYLKSLLTITEHTDLSITAEESNQTKSIIGKWQKESASQEGGDYPGDKYWELKVTFDENGRFIWDSKRKDQNGTIIDESLKGTYTIEKGYLISYHFDRPSDQAMQKLPELFAFWPNQLLGQQLFRVEYNNLSLSYSAGKTWISLKKI